MLLNCVFSSFRTDLMAKNPLFRVSQKVGKGHFKMPRAAATKMSATTKKVITSYLSIFDKFFFFGGGETLFWICHFCFVHSILLMSRHHLNQRASKHNQILWYFKLFTTWNITITIYHDVTKHLFLKLTLNHGSWRLVVCSEDDVIMTSRESSKWKTLACVLGCCLSKHT